MPGRGKDVKPSHCELRFREEKKKRKREIEGKSEDREKKWGRREKREALKILQRQKVTGFANYGTFKLSWTNLLSF